MSGSKVLSREEQYQLELIKDLFSPRGDGLKVGLTNRLHDGQIEALRPLYEDDVNTLMLPCGRKFGKTDAAAFVLWKQALMEPGSACYFIAPEGSHGRELLWRNNRLQTFMGKDTKKYIKSITNQDMTIHLKNGSFIRIMGSENWAAGNGLTPHIAVYDEFKAFHPQWHIEFSPNRAAKAAKLVIIGTLPKPGDRNMEQYNQVLDYCEQDKKSAVVYRTTWDNPINHLPAQKETIEQDIKRLESHDDFDVVQREYYSKIVAGGSSSIFPMLDPEVHVMRHHEMLKEIGRDLKKMEWYIIADPGTTTCFAILFACVNPYTKKMYLIDEVYAKDQKKTSTKEIYKEIFSKSRSINPHIDLDEWYKVYDEAGAWFANEILQSFNITFFKTEKRHGDKEEGLSVIKDQLIHHSVAISDKCDNLFKEMQMYAKDGKGKIPKKNDHLIDCYRYLIYASHYDFNAIQEYVRGKDPMEEGRFRGFGQGYEEEEKDDWTLGFGDEFDLDI
jgi:hypothetical protein